MYVCMYIYCAHLSVQLCVYACVCVCVLLSSILVLIIIIIILVIILVVVLAITIVIMRRKIKKQQMFEPNMEISRYIFTYYSIRTCTCSCKHYAFILYN